MTTPRITPPPLIAELVARFDANIDALKSGSYNETQLRREFVDPFFEALGWDVHNKGGLAESYKDVITVKTERSVPRGYVPCYTGQDVGRFVVAWNGLACLDNTIAQCGGCWDRDKHEARSKLLTRQVGTRPRFGIDQRGFHCLNTIFMVTVFAPSVNPLFLLGILNSRLIGALWLDRFYDRRGTFPKIKGTYLKELPIVDPSKLPKSRAALEPVLIETVQMMLKSIDRKSKVKTAHERTAIERQIAALDAQIDQHVYRLYALTDDEIRIVEQATSPHVAESAPD